MDCSFLPKGVAVKPHIFKVDEKKRGYLLAKNSKNNSRRENSCAAIFVKELYKGFCS